MSSVLLVRASLDSGSLTLTFSFPSHWLCRFSFSGGWRIHGLSCHLPSSTVLTPPPVCCHPPGLTGLDGSLQLLLKWSRPPPAAGGAAATGEGAMVTLTLRAPVRSWRNSVFLNSFVYCLCVAVPLPAYPSPPSPHASFSYPCFDSHNPQ